MKVTFDEGITNGNVLTILRDKDLSYKRINMSES